MKKVVSEKTNQEWFDPDFIEAQKLIIESRMEKYGNLQKFRQEMRENGAGSHGTNYLLYKNNEVLPQLKKALQKIKDGTYGVCEKCGKNIEKRRLELIPGALVCMNCM